MPYDTLLERENNMSGKNNIQRVINVLGKALLIGAAFSTFSSWIYADEGKGQGHTAPHGGIVSQAGKYDVELLVKDKEVILICPTLKGKPVPVVDKEAELFVQLPDNRKQTVPLIPIIFENAPCLEGRVHLTGADSFQASVSLKIDGERRTAKFSYIEKPHLDTR